METILIRERYKVVRVLFTGKDYVLAEAVDIQDRETPVCLVNLYEGELLHRYGKVFSDLRAECCPAFQRVFLERGALAAVFSSQQGVPIDRMFYRKDKWAWQARLEYAEQLLHAALLLDDLPFEIGCAALRSENVLFSPQGRSIRLQFAVLPMEEMNGRELSLMAGDQVQKILPGRLTGPDEEFAFRKQIRRGEYPPVVTLYSAWKEVRGQIQAGYEEWGKKGWFRKGWTLLKRAIKRRKSA